MSSVITVENLGKKYQLSHQGQLGSYVALRDVLTEGAKSLGRRLLGGQTAGRAASEEFWALRDLSFQVKPGERLGIIGRNGAGKSTLLKILSRITQPSTGQVRIRGRVASLLEVGTGFHPELTGRENIFLNGAVLGMGRTEIKRKFDQIVEFAEIAKFLDTPVKRYSSGMYVRLAFGVAAHLEPEILIVDEVLAVGDAQFQKKCLGKMEEVGREGRTVLFVSHNMAAIENLCSTAITLHHGAKVFQGDVGQAVGKYLGTLTVEPEVPLELRTDRTGRGRVRMHALDIEDEHGNCNIPFPIGSRVEFRIKYSCREEVANPRVIIGVYDNFGVGITRLDTEITGAVASTLSGSGSIVCSTRELNFPPGRYVINIAIFGNGEMEDYLIAAGNLDITGSDFFCTGRIFDEADSKLTKVLVGHRWRVSP